jgi:predicted SAM-dependent methyltransferase
MLPYGKARCGMDERIRRLVSPLDLSGLGLEVAPYFRPVLRKCSHNVRYVDYIDNDEIVKKAASNPSTEKTDTPKIDWVWTPGKPLRQCIPSDITFSYAIASHVMEHVPNPVGWLNEILEVMHEGAVLALALPDRRFTMDFYRRETTFADLMSLWLTAPPVPTPAQTADFLTNTFHDVREVPLSKAEWRKKHELASLTQMPRIYSDQDAWNFALMSARQQYIDIHCTVWTPDSFNEAFPRVIDLGLMNISFSVSESVAELDEFIVHLTKRGAPRVKRNELFSPHDNVAVAS